MRGNASLKALLRGVGQDARYALRAVRRDLGLCCFAVVILGIGIGATTAVFSVVSPLLLQPLPFGDSERLVWIANDGDASGGMSAVTSRTSNLRDFRERSRSFDGLTGYFAFFEQASYNLVTDGRPERLVGVDVAQDFLEVLGVTPLVGRNFVDEEGLWGGRAAVILTHALWIRRFGADPAVVGTSIRLNGAPREVVGVLPASFDFASVFAPRSRVDFLLPFPITTETDRWGNTISMIGRLRPDATVPSAQADLDSIVAALEADDPRRWGLGARVTKLQEQIAGPHRSALLLLAAAAAAVMLIVCVNLSNLLLAKGPKRAREMAARSALGAPRSRLVRQLLLESLLLSIGGAAVGVAIAKVATQLVAGSAAIDIPMLRSISIDSSALWFTLAMAVLTGLAIGVVPAFQVAGGGESNVLRDASRNASASRRSTRTRDALVVAEVGLACVLLVFGGLLLKSFQKVLDVDLGFEPAQAVSWVVRAERSFETLAEANVFYDRMLTEVEAISGVDGAALADALPLGSNRTWDLRAFGSEEQGADDLLAFPHIVDSRYLATMQIPLLDGRGFSRHDTRDRASVVILNETAARAVFDGADPLGRKVVFGGGTAEVIGVAGDVRHQSLEQGSGLEVYLPYTQNGDFNRMEMVVRSRLPQETLAGSVAAAIATVDPDMPTDDYRTLETIVERSLSPRRFTLLVLGAFAATALLLAAFGIYGVLSYSVAERTSEIGIRMALGATRGRILRRVIARTVLLAVLGVGFGAAGSVLVTRSVASLLFDVTPTDPTTFVVMAALLLLVAALAGMLPALRASRTSSTVVLQAQ